MNFNFFSWSEKWASALRWTALVGIFAICLAPLIMVPGFFFPFIVPRNLWFRILVELVGASAALLLIGGQAAWPRRDRIMQAYGLFVGVATLSSMFGLGFFRSFWGNYERMEGVIHLWHLLIFLVSLRVIVTRVEHWQALLSWNVLVGMALALAGGLQYAGFVTAGLTDRVGGTTGNPAYLAGLLAVQLFFVLYFLVFPDRFRARLVGFGWLAIGAWAVLAQLAWSLFGEAGWGLWSFLKQPMLTAVWQAPVVLIIYLAIGGGLAAAAITKRTVLVRLTLGLVFAADAFILLQTQTRGAFLGVYIAALALAVVTTAWFRGSTTQRRLGQVSLAVLLCVPALVFALRWTPLAQTVPLVTRLTSFSFSDITTESRLLTWQASWRGWTHDPRHFVFGYGLEHYGRVFDQYFPAKIFRDPGSQIWFDHAHNMFFDTVVTTGLLGLLALVWFFVRVFAAGKASWVERRLTGEAILLGAIVAYVVQNFFVFDTLNTQLFVLVAIGAIAASAQTADEPKPWRLDPFMQWVGAGAVVVVCLLGLFLVNVRTASANRHLLQAITLGRVDGGEQAAVDHFIQAIRMGWGGRFEARDQFASFAQQALITNRPGAQGAASSALVQLAESVAEEPFNAHHYLVLGQFRNDYGVLDAAIAKQAIPTLQQGITLSPTRPQFWFALGRAYFQTGQANEGVAAYEHAVALAPWAIDSHIQLLSIYGLANKPDLVEAELKKIVQLQVEPLAEGDVRRLHAILSRTKQFGLLIEVYQRELRSPTAPVSYLWGLAEAYVGAGKPADASRLLTEVGKRAPQFKDRAEEVRQQLKLPSP